MFIKKSNLTIKNIILLASLLCVGANANEIKNQEIIKEKEINDVLVKLKNKLDLVQKF